MYIPKKAMRIYQMFRKNFNEARMDELKGEAKINKFLQCIDFEDADELVKKMLLLAEKEPYTKDLRFPYFCKKMNNEYSYQEFSKMHGEAFRKWRHYEEVQNEIGKTAGIFDIIKLYQLLKSGEVKFEK